MDINHHGQRIMKAVIRAFVKKHAFTIFELSIGLVIIGAIAGGVTVGKTVIDRAEYKSILGTFNALQLSVEDFQKTYGGLPGDLASTGGLGAAVPAGNGDGSINTIAEASNFWTHLGLANLLPPGLNPSAVITPTDGSTPIMPSARHKTNGFTASSNGQVLRLGFSGYSSATSNNAALRPDAAFFMDELIDDGKPSTGTLIGIQGSNIAAANMCIESGVNDYNKDQPQPACRIAYDIKLAPTTEAPTADDCGGSSVGKSRVSTSDTCDTGFQGSVIESCTTQGGTTAWRNTRRLCDLRLCAGGLRVGETNNISCPEGYTGAVTLTCQNTGVLKTTSNTCTPIVGETCTTGETRFLACPYGQQGVRQQECIASAWAAHSTDSGSCTDITCSGTSIGDPTVSTASCPLNHAGAIGDTQEACTMLGMKVVGSACRPEYGTCTAGATQEIGCPNGQTGSHFQICNADGNWETNDLGGGNSCVPVTCGGEPVGATRLSDDKYCPLNRPGKVYEICDSDGAWKLSYANCASETCPTSPDTLGNANWSSGPYVSGEEYTSTDCLAGYTGSAIRRCSLGGTWLAPTQSCTFIADCPAGNHNSSHTTWVLTPTGDTASIIPDGDPATATHPSQDNTCLSGYFTNEVITRYCNAGTWDAPSRKCSPGIEGMASYWYQP